MLRSFRSHALNFCRVLLILIMLFVELFPQQHFVDETAIRLPDLPDLSKEADVGDVDGDGDLDIIVGDDPFVTPGYNHLLINDGNGYFTDGSNQLPQIAEPTNDLEFGDVDNDGDLDLVISNITAPWEEYLPIRIWMNDGSGYFTDETEIRVELPDTLNGWSVRLGDVDSDGDLDMVVTGGRGFDPPGAWSRWTLFVNDGSGFFTLAPDTVFTLLLYYQIEEGKFSDIDGDLDLDLILVDYNFQRNVLFLNDGTGQFTDATEERLPADTSGARAIDIGDVDVDGDVDLLFGCAGQNLLYINDGLGYFTDETFSRIPLNEDENSWDIAFGDIDGDGDLDYVTADGMYPDEDHLYLNDGQGYFTDVTDERLPATPNSSGKDAEFFDADGDGDLDLFVANSGDLRNHLFINYEAMPDTLPPVILKLTNHADTNDTIGPYIIQGTITDNTIWMDSVFLYYHTQSAEDFQKVLMRKSGGKMFWGAIPGQPYETEMAYYVEACDRYTNSARFPQTAPDSVYSFLITNITEVVEDEPGNRIENYRLFQNYPNPFNAVTTLRYNLPEQAHVTLTIYDVLGKEVRKIVNGIEEPGYRSVVWDAGNVSSGVYFYRLTVRQSAPPERQRRAGSWRTSHVETRKLIVLK